MIDDFTTTITEASVTVKDNRGKEQTTGLWSGGSADINAYSSSDRALAVLMSTGGAFWSVKRAIIALFCQLAFHLSTQNERALVLKWILPAP